MIRKPEGYDAAPAYTGESELLPKGKYVCVVKQVNVQTDNHGNEVFYLLYDIAEGEHKDFYRKQYEARKMANPVGAKWPAVHRQNIGGKGLPWFKGLITCLERSNPGFAFQWNVPDNEKLMVGKRFGGVFRREQFEGRDGARPFTTKLYQVRSVAGLAEAEIPEDYLLPEDGPRQTANQGAQMDNGFVNIPEGVGDEGIPFM